MSSSVFYDDDNDVLHLAFRIDEDVCGPAVERCLDARRIVFEDRDGGLLAIELREASRGVVLDGLPARTLVGRTLERMRREQGWKYHAVR